MALQSVRDPSRPRNDKGAAIVLGAGAAALLLLWLKDRGGTGAACGACAAANPTDAPPDGLWTTCSVPGNPNSCTIWAVSTLPSGQKVRNGITTPAQLTRCYGPNPVTNLLDGSPYGFGNGDTTAFVGDIGDVSAGCACPNVPH